MIHMVRRRDITDVPVFAVYRWTRMYNLKFRVYMENGRIYVNAWTVT